MNLDALTALARESSSWDDARASRVLGATLRRREAQIARQRHLRRGLVVAAGAAAIVLLLLRGSQGAEPTMAQVALDDAGLARD